MDCALACGLIGGNTGNIVCGDLARRHYLLRCHACGVLPACPDACAEKSETKPAGCRKPDPTGQASNKRSHPPPLPAATHRYGLHHALLRMYMPQCGTPDVSPPAEIAHLCPPTPFARKHSYAAGNSWSIRVSSCSVSCR